MVRRSVRQASKRLPLCANCHTNSNNRLCFTDVLPEWSHHETYDTFQLHNNDHDDLDNDTVQDEKPDLTDDGSIRTSRHRTSVTSPEQPTCNRSITVFDALLKVFELHWNSQEVFKKSTVAQKENLWLCSTCVWCLSQLHDGLIRFTKMTSDANKMSYLDPFIFPKRKPSEYVEENASRRNTSRGKSQSFVHTGPGIDTNDNDLQVAYLKEEADPSELEFADVSRHIDDQLDVMVRKDIMQKSKGIRSRTRGSSSKAKAKRGKATPILARSRQTTNTTESNRDQHVDQDATDDSRTKQDSELDPAEVITNDYACVVCNSTFSTRDDLEGHCSSTHVPSIRTRCHKCAQCGKAFLTERDLKTHSSVHDATDPVSCDQCSFKTRRPQDLNRHVRLVHLQEKSHACADCGKEFTLRWQLADHERLHNEDRNYACPQPGCDKTFKTSSVLRQHLELHRGSKFMCDICGQSYSRKAYLRLHMNGTHLMLPLPPSRERRKRLFEVPVELPRVMKAKREKVTMEAEPILELAEDQDVKVQAEIFPDEELVAELREEDVDQGEDDEGEYCDTEPEAPEEPTSEAPLTATTEPVYEHVDPPETLHVQLDLESVEADTITVVDSQTQGDACVDHVHDVQDPTTFTITEGHQIICYPMNIISTEGGNTFYITTAPPPPTNPPTTTVEDSDPAPITVFTGSFGDFLSSHQQ